MRQGCLASRDKLEIQVQAEPREKDREMVGTQEGKRSPSPGFQSKSLASSEARSSCSCQPAGGGCYHIPCVALVASASRHPSFAHLSKRKGRKRFSFWDATCEPPTWYRSVATAERIGWLIAPFSCLHLWLGMSCFLQFFWRSPEPCFWV